MAYLNPVINAPSTQSQQEEQKSSSMKRSKSLSPFSAVTDAPPPKRQMFSPPITPWITRHDTTRRCRDNYRREALFDFLNTNFPHVCEENGWEERGEAELIELAVSIMIQLDGDKDHSSTLLNSEIYDHSSETLQCLLLKISQIRQCAVHRTKKIPVITLELMVRDAVYVTSYLQDKERTEILDSICRPLEPLSFNLEARFGERLAKKAQRNLERINNKVKQLQELLKEEEFRQGVANMEMDNIQRQDEEIYDGRLESLKMAL